MGDAERRESLRQSIRRLAAIANGDAINGMELELVETREQQLGTYFQRFHELHLDIVAGSDADDDELRQLNEEVLFETEELYMTTRARFVRAIRRKEHERRLEEGVDNLAAAVRRQAAGVDGPNIAGTREEVIEEPADGDHRVAIGGEAARPEPTAAQPADPPIQLPMEHGAVGGHQAADADANANMDPAGLRYAQCRRVTCRERRPSNRE